MSFSGDQTVKKTDVFIGERSRNGVILSRAVKEFATILSKNPLERYTCLLQQLARGKP
jgi:hypothetical protein